MKQIIKRDVLLILMIVGATVWPIRLIAQEKPIRSTEINAPSKEKFEPATGLIAPWRSGGCIMGGHSEHLKTCYWVTFKEYAENSNVSLFNADGTDWYTFDLQPGKSAYWWADKNKNFRPFSTGTSPSSTSEQYPQVVILRLVSESSSWYEVEINENTMETRFVLKTDPRWIRNSWDHWLADGVNLILSETQDSLCEIPNGKIIPDSAGLKFTRVKFLRTEGDWAYVRGQELRDGRLVAPKLGWMKWRNGRKLLVGCIFNNFIVPTYESVA